MQAAVALAALAVVAVALAVTGPHVAHLYDVSGIATCQARGNCGPLISSFQSKLDAEKIDQFLYFLGIGAMFVVPAIIGMFWGAPAGHPRNSRPAPSGWRGLRASPAPAGWPSSSASSDWAPWPPPGCSA